MVLDSNSFGSKLQDLVSDLESDNLEQAELKIGDAITFLEDIERQSADGTNFDPHKIRVTLIALGKARSALWNGQNRAALANSRDATDEWERNPD